MNSSDISNNYCLILERKYSELLVKAINEGKSPNTVELPSGSLKELNERQNIKDFEQLKDDIQARVLSYLQLALFIQSQDIRFVGRAVLEIERDKQQLQRETARKIKSAIILSKLPIISNLAAPHNVDEKWELYSQHLFEAAKPGSRWLTSRAAESKIQAELKLLQTKLGLSDDEIPSWETMKSLKTERGVNYLWLWRHLKQQNWKAANLETYQCLVEADGHLDINLDRNSIKRLSRIDRISDPDDIKRLAMIDSVNIERISLDDLKTIDSLWSAFSDARFGFRAQLKILEKFIVDLEKLNQKVDRRKLLEKLGEKLDWRRNNCWISYESVDFSLKATPGHLPVFPGLIGWWVWHDGKLQALLNRYDQIQKLSGELRKLSDELSKAGSKI